MLSMPLISSLTDSFALYLPLADIVRGSYSPVCCIHFALQPFLLATSGAEPQRVVDELVALETEVVGALGAAVAAKRREVA